MAGRPSKLTDTLSAKMVALYKEGKTDRQVARITGISVRAIHYWKSKYPEFLHSLKEAKNIADELVEACLYARATGYNYWAEKQFRDKFGNLKRVKVPVHCPPNVLAIIFWLRNRRPDQWKK